MKQTSFYLQQMQKRVEELGGLRYRKKIMLDRFQMTEDDGEKVNPKVPKYEQEIYLSKNDFWSGRDKYVWLHHCVTIPEGYSKTNTLGYFDFGKTGLGNNSAFESMIYINGKEYQGVDTNHKEVFFPLAETGYEFEIDFRLWSGLEGGGEKQIQYHQFKEAFLAELDMATDDLYYLGKNIVETIPLLPEEDPLRYRLEMLLVDAMRLVDYTNVGTDAFYESVAAASKFLNQQLAGMERKDLYSLTCTGHTHIDVAWLWRLKHTREKIARSFSTVLRLMERFEEYRFIQTQAQLYDYLRSDFPEIYEKIKEKVKAGKWEPSGSMWVEADCNLTGGESIVRQILYAKKFFKEEFDFENTFLWLPDVFGYSWALPQILKKAGIDTFITTKISWSEINRMPNDTFLWRGIDGTEILTHFITTPETDHTTWFYTYNGELRPRAVKGIWSNYRNKDLNQSLLMSYGYGDGGGGANRDMLENSRRIAKLPSMPQIVMGSVTDYLKELHTKLHSSDNRGHLAVWDNELYLEFHRGTYTSQSYNKKMNRKLELAYREAELLSVMQGIKDALSSYPYKELYEGWKIILRNQFHDIIPGSSIEEVYQDSKKEYAQAWEIVENLIPQGISETSESMAVLNSTLWEREDLLELEVATGRTLVEENGQKLRSQTYAGKQFFLVSGLKPLEMRRFKLAKQETEDRNSRFQHSHGTAESRFYRLSWNDKGQLTEVFDKMLGQNVLTGIGNELQIFEDKPRMYDAWELEATIDDKKEIIDQFLGAEVVSEGELFLRIRFGWKYNKSSFKQDLVLYDHTKRIDFITEVDWQEREKVLKVAFPVDVRAVTARYDIQFGNVERPTHQSTSWDAAKFEVVGHQWADLEETGLGVALMNDCKYGYDIKENTIRLTLLKSAIYPDVHADLGVQQFTYSFFVHQDTWHQAGVHEQAWNLNHPLKAMPQQGWEKSLFAFEGKGIALDAMKKAEAGKRMVIRMHEWTGGKNKAELSCHFPVKCWYECDLMEMPTGKQQEGDKILLSFKPYEIKTIILEL